MRLPQQGHFSVEISPKTMLAWSPKRCTRLSGLPLLYLCRKLWHSSSELLSILKRWEGLEGAKRNNSQKREFYSWALRIKSTKADRSVNNVHNRTVLGDLEQIPKLGIDKIKEEVVVKMENREEVQPKIKIESTIVFCKNPRRVRLDIERTTCSTHIAPHRMPF